MLIPPEMTEAVLHPIEPETVPAPEQAPAVLAEPAPRVPPAVVPPTPDPRPDDTVRAETAPPPAAPNRNR